MKKSKNFFKKDVLKNIVVLEYYDHQAMGQALKRLLPFHELCEDAELNKKKSALALEVERVKDQDDFSQYEGFFLSSKTIKQFTKHFSDLKPREKEFISALRKKRGSFGVIWISPDTKAATVTHEIAHALWALNPRYQRDVKKVLKSVPLKPIFEILRKEGYQEHILLDEAQAYLMNNPYWLKDFGLKKLDRYAKAVLKLNYLFEKYTDDNYPFFKKVAWK